MKVLVACVAALAIASRELPAQIAEATAAERAGNLAEALQDYRHVLGNLPYPAPPLQDARLRERIINLVKRLPSPPAVPEEATLAIERGRTFVRVATGDNDFERAAREFAGAVRAAPWFPGAMLNLAIVQERLHQYNHAATNLHLFLLAAPNDPQAAAARTKMAELQVLAERAADSIPWQNRNVGKSSWSVQERTIEGATERRLHAETHGFNLWARCRRGEPDVYIHWGRPLGDNPMMSYRIGNGPQIQEPWSASTDRVASFFPADPFQLLADVATNGDLDVRVTTTDGNQLHASFGNSGLDRALPPFRAACPTGDAALGGFAQPARPNPYVDTLFRAVEAAARSQGGEPPREVRYIVIDQAEFPLSTAIMARDTSKVPVVVSAFQIRYANRWIMVDAGMDSATLHRFWPQYPGTWRRAQWDSTVAGLRGAAMVVLTHEHYDHAAGAEVGPVAREIAPRILVTQSQLAAMRSPPVTSAYLRLPADSAPEYQMVNDTLLRAIAPGVVLIRAPGHSPGSQMVFVHTASGRDILLVGDLVWNVAGLDRDRQREEATSQNLLEDREAIQQQIDWVRWLVANHNVIAVPCHDGRWLESLATRGLLAAGLDLRTQ